MTVLFLASPSDSEAASVAEAVVAQGVPVAWLDTAWFPEKAHVSAELTSQGWRADIATPRGPIYTDDVSAVFYTQSQPFTFPNGLSEPELRFVTIEARFGLGGLLAALPVRWVSHPSSVADAEYRIRQMDVAARCGFHLPPSLMTNDVQQARHFAADHPSIVYKAIMHKLISEEEQIKLIYTTPVDPASLDERVGFTAHLFQRNVTDKVFDVRVVATRGGACFGVAIRTDDPTALQDWRTGWESLTYESIDVPRPIAAGCQNLMRALDLRMGVFDFSVDRSGAWWYLEVNPGGRWAWLQAETGLPIAQAIAAELTSTDRR
jgi:hypothetical protein